MTQNEIPPTADDDRGDTENAQAAGQVRSINTTHGVGSCTPDQPVNAEPTWRYFYVLEDRSPKFTLEQNPGYWGGAPATFDQLNVLNERNLVPALLCHASGLVVIDCDVSDTPDYVQQADGSYTMNFHKGVDDLYRVTGELGQNVADLDTYSVLTKSGGTHLYFRQNPELTVRSKPHRKGWLIDIKATENSWVVCPPAPKYSVINDVPVKTLPLWLAQFIMGDLRKFPEKNPRPKKFPGLKTVKGKNGDQHGFNGDMSALPGYIEAILQWVRDSNVNGCWNNTIHDASHMLFRAGINVDEVVEMVVEAAEPRDDREQRAAEKTVRSAWNGRERDADWFTFDPEALSALTSGDSDGNDDDDDNDDVIETVDGSNDEAARPRSAPIFDDITAGDYGSPATPVVTADAFEELWRDKNTGVMRRRMWNDMWYDWIGSHWVEVEDKAVKGSLYRVLKNQSFVKVDEKGEEKKATIVAWNPTQRSVSNVLDAMTGTDIFTPKMVPMPSWFPRAGEEARTDRLVSMENGLLNLNTKELIQHTPQYFNGYSLPFSYDPNAKCPIWTSYLNSIFVNDPDTIALLQEWAGYVLSGRIDLQKMLFLVGPTRSGKGTFSRIMELMVGEGNYTGPTIDSITTNFGLEDLIDKQVATFDDVRLDPRANNYSVAIERLLSITGAGTLSVDRKNKKKWVGKIPARLMFMTNVIPELEDIGGALPNRMLVAVYKRSFLGREDPSLVEKLSADLTGIFNWALDGLDRLDRNGGRFTQPHSSAETREELRDNSNEIHPFVRDNCQLGDDQWCWCDELYNIWAMDHGGFKDDAKQKRRFGKLLKAGYPNIERKQKRVDGKMRYYYQGISLAFGISTE